ncbi:MAG: GNAT family N-acetyltransferase [Atopobiaceae bacterium]|nr:GNAT family N-acetyltransferase [Atopobiaceae bacterium]
MITALLDTNVIMDMEDTGRHLSRLAASVLQKSRGNVDFFIHELQREDINNDGNESRRELLLTRIEQFKLIDHPPTASVEVFAEYGWETKSRNDFIDNALLLCVEKHVVGFLITNDKGILVKAAASGLRDRVLKLEEFEQVLPTADEPIDLAAVDDIHCYELDINDSFFDSLREAYPGFNDWFNTKCCETQRRCWVVKSNDGIGGLCIYKDEEGEAVNDSGFVPDGRVLKLCTFKVGESARGSKIGERLLYCAFQYALKNDYATVYFTTDEDKQTNLIALGHEFGFDKCGYHGSDAVYLKYMMPQSKEANELETSEYMRRYYPCYRGGRDVGKYLVPIMPEWHERLFPDISETSRSLLRDMPEFYKAEGNTIKKAYLSKSQIATPKVGDLLLFYRTVDRQEIDTMGVVVGVTRSSDVSEIVALTKRRTVYDPIAIREMVENAAAKQLLIISFNLIRYFEEHPVTLAEMQGLGIAHPQSITTLSEERFEGLMKLLL